MTAVATSTSGYLERPRSSGLAEVIDIILDKGLVIDAFVRVSLLGLELLTIDARIVIASVDTYLRFAEAVDRVVLAPAPTTGVPELLEKATGGGVKEQAKSAAGGVKEAIGLGDDDEDSGDQQGERQQRGQR